MSEVSWTHFLSCSHPVAPSCRTTPCRQHSVDPLAQTHADKTYALGVTELLQHIAVRLPPVSLTAAATASSFGTKLKTENAFRACTAAAKVLAIAITTVTASSELCQHFMQL